MKKFLQILFALNMLFLTAQSGNDNASVQLAAESQEHTPVNRDVPELIPQQRNGSYGFVDRKGNLVIRPEYSNVGFFTEDCNLLNSPNAKVRKFGSDQFASVRKGGVDFRIDKKGKRVYQYKNADLAKCPFEFKKQRYFSYIRQGYYGIIEETSFTNPEDYRNYIIYPQYTYLHIMEGDDLNNPMIIASRNNRFGVIDIHNKVIIPFEYSDIKRNYSWKLARLFEVTKDGKNYYYIDAKNKGY